MGGRAERLAVPLLIADTLDGDVLSWLSQRHGLRRLPDRQRDPAAVRRALHGMRAAILPTTMPVDEALLRDHPGLEVVARVDGSAEQIDLDACAAFGVEVVRTPVAWAMAEAEFTVGAVLQLLRRLPQPRGEIYRTGRELGSCTVGVIGLPPAARALGEVLGGFGSTLIGYDPAVHANDPVWAQWRIAARPCSEVLSRADVLCVLLPTVSRYRGLFGERLLQRCRHGQIVFCLGSSAVFDEAALARALNDGQLAAAWLDQVEPGALEPGRPLVDARSLYITPHLAAATRESSRRAEWMVARRIDERLRAAVPQPADADPEEDFRATEPGELLGLSAGHATP